MGFEFCEISLSIFDSIGRRIRCLITFSMHLINLYNLFGDQIFERIQQHMAQMSNTSLAHLWVIDRRYYGFANNNNNKNIHSKWKWQLQFSYAPVHTSGWYRFCMFNQFDRMMVRKYDFNGKLSELIETFFLYWLFDFGFLYVIFNEWAGKVHTFCTWLYN